MTLIVAMLYLPIATLVAFSFNADRFPSLPWRQSTLHWYYALLGRDDFYAALNLSFRTAATTTILSLAVGVTSAWALIQSRLRVTTPFAAILCIPMLVPPLMLGLAMRITSNSIADISPFWRLVLAHSVTFSPLVFAFTFARMLGTSRNFELVARDLGASPVQAAVRVHLPMTASAALGASFIVFALSWDEFTMSWMLLDLDPTFPVKVWGMMEGAVSPEINAIGSITLAVSLSTAALAVWLLSRRTIPLR